MGSIVGAEEGDIDWVEVVVGLLEESRVGKIDDNKVGILDGGMVGAEVGSTYEIVIEPSV